MMFPLRFHRWQRLVVLFTAAFFISSLPVFSPRRSWAFSLSDEKKLGAAILEQIHQRMPLIEDGEAITYVNSVGNRIARQLGTTTYQFQFFIVNQPVPNAFAIPGGYIFVYRGLMEMMTSEGELASILAHELSHINARHIYRQMDNQKILSVASLAGILAGIFMGGAGAGALAMGSAAGAQTAALKYSRENEEEADQMGFRLLCEAGYPPEDMVSMMGKLSQKQQYLTNSRIPSYLMTHPGVGDRIQYLQQMVQKERRTGKKARAESLGDFPVMQASMIAQYGDPKAAAERFGPAAKQGDAIASYGMGRLALREGRFEEAVAYLRDAARKKSDSPFVLSTLGAAYMQQGKFDDARSVLRSALAVDPAGTIPHYRLALVLQEQGQREEALEHLSRIEAMAPSFPEIDYQMGIVLGQVNRIGEAHLHLGRYYARKCDWKAAYFHYTKAKSLLKSSPQQIEEIDQVLKEVEKKRKSMAGGKSR